MPGHVLEGASFVNLTASGQIGPVGATSVTILGFYVNSTTSGTIAFTLVGSGGTVVSGTITPAIGFHRFPATCLGGAYATIGATLNVTIFYVPNE